MKEKAMEGSKKNLKIVDKRRVGRDESIVPEEPNVKPTYIQQLEQKVIRMETALKQKIEELERESVKSRERVTKDLEKRFEEKLDKVFYDLFDIFDSIDKAIELSTLDAKTMEGLQIIKASLENFFKKHNIEVINPQEEEFDPNLMEALQMVEGKQNRVVKVLQKGFKRDEKVLRAAKVSVGSGN